MEDIIPRSNVDEKLSLEHRLLNVNDSSELDDIVALFNLNQRKKNMLRTLKLDDLIDTITDRMVLRIESDSCQLDAETLSKCLKAAESVKDKSMQIATNTVATPLIVKNTQVNVNVKQNELDRESRDRVAQAIQKILARSSQDETSQDIVEGSIVEVEDSESNQE